MKIAASNKFAAIVINDHFAPKVPCGSHLIFKRGELARPGDIVAVRYSSNGPKRDSDAELDNDPKLDEDPELQDDTKLDEDLELEDDLDFCIEPFREGVGYFVVAVQASFSVRGSSDTQNETTGLKL